MLPARLLTMPALAMLISILPAASLPQLRHLFCLLLYSVP